jgi:hypothetical protein
MRLPGTERAKPHCGLIASRSNGACRVASSIRQRKVSADSASLVFVVTRPSTAIPPFGKKRSGSNPPARNEITFLGLKDKTKDPTVFYTNELIPEINRFDKHAITAAARTFKVPSP